MRCVNCGTEFADGSAQCPVCGASAAGQQAQQSYGGQYQQNMQQPYGSQYQQNMQQPYGGQYQQNAQQPYGSQYQQNAQQPYGEQYQQNMQQPYGGQYQQNAQQPYGEQYQQNVQQPYGGQYQQNMQQPYGGPSQQNKQQVNNPGIGMGWFKFVIYFQLFANAFVNIINGVAYLTGRLYLGKKDLVYAFYPSLRIFDVCLGIGYLLIAGYAIYTRMMLAKYKKTGPLNLYICMGLNILMGVLSYAVASAFAGTGMMAEAVTRSMIPSIALLVWDVTYFNKRKHLFVN